MKRDKHKKKDYLNLMKWEVKLKYSKISMRLGKLRYFKIKEIMKIFN